MNTPQAQAVSPLPLTTHNGVISISRKNTTHVFRARTNKNGKRIVECRAGSKHWWYVGALDDTGKVVLSGWKSRDKEYVAKARILNHAAELVAVGTINVTFTGKCRRCNRALSDPISAQNGIGPICAEKEIERAGRLAGTRDPLPTTPPAKPDLNTLSDDQLKQLYKNEVDRYNTYHDDMANSDDDVARAGKKVWLIWKAMESRPGLSEYHRHVSVNHEDYVS